MKYIVVSVLASGIINEVYVYTGDEVSLAEETFRELVKENIDLELTDEEIECHLEDGNCSDTNGNDVFITWSENTTEETNQDIREEMIKNIRRILKEYGETSSSELELESSPCIAVLGNVSQLVEGFGVDKVMYVTYSGESEMSEDYVEYESLETETLAEIELIISEYEADCIRTEKRCSN